MAAQHNDNPVFLMCPPEHYAITPHPVAGHANDMSIAGERAYRKDPAAFRTAAMRKWEAFRAILENELGAEIITLEPEPNLTDQVFAADASISLTAADAQTSVALLSKFTYEERQAEADSHIKALRSFDKNREIHYASYNIEGCGDNVYDPYRDIFWSGCTPSPSRQTAGDGRSDARAHEQLAAITGVRVVSLEVCRPFFHLDTTLAVLPNGHIMCCAHGLSEDAHREIIARAFTPFGLSPHEYLIEISREDASFYACNIVARDNKIVLPEVSTELLATLRSKGYDPIPIDLKEFIHSGGGPHCLVNQLNTHRTTAKIPAQKQ